MEDSVQLRKLQPARWNLDRRFEVDVGFCSQTETDIHQFALSHLPLAIVPRIDQIHTDRGAQSAAFVIGGKGPPFVVDQPSGGQEIFDLKLQEAQGRVKSSTRWRIDQAGREHKFKLVIVGRCPSRVDVNPIAVYTQTESKDIAQIDGDLRVNIQFDTRQGHAKVNWNLFVKDDSLDDYIELDVVCVSGQLNVVR